MKQQTIEKVMDEDLRGEFLTYQISEADRKMNLARRKLYNCYKHKKKLMTLRDEVSKKIQELHD